LTKDSARVTTDALDALGVAGGGIIEPEKP
jgi:hypothetical protein